VTYHTLRVLEKISHRFLKRKSHLLFAYFVATIYKALQAQVPPETCFYRRLRLSKGYPGDGYGDDSTVWLLLSQTSNKLKEKFQRNQSETAPPKNRIKLSIFSQENIHSFFFNPPSPCPPYSLLPPHLRSSLPCWDLAGFVGCFGLVTFEYAVRLETSRLRTERCAGPSDVEASSQHFHAISL
jgi:hypothetical protein